MLRKASLPPPAAPSSPTARSPLNPPPPAVPCASPCSQDQAAVGPGHRRRDAGALPGNAGRQRRWVGGCACKHAGLLRHGTTYACLPGSTAVGAPHRGSPALTRAPPVPPSGAAPQPLHPTRLHATPPASMPTLQASPTLWLPCPRRRRWSPAGRCWTAPRTRPWVSAAAPPSCVAPPGGMPPGREGGRSPPLSADPPHPPTTNARFSAQAPPPPLASLTC